MKLIILNSLFFLLLLSGRLHSQESYRAEVKRKDGNKIVFNIYESYFGGKVQWTITNHTEKLEVTDIRKKGDSFLINLPLFEAQFRLKKVATGYAGIWIKQTSLGEQIMPMVMEKGKSRNILPKTGAPKDFSGKWRATFYKADGRTSQILAEFDQKGSYVSGTFLTPTGDYRFLEGTVAGDSMVLSTFDGTHAFVFGAHLSENGEIDKGIFISGPELLERWTALRDNEMTIDESLAAMQLKSGESRLDFRFPDLDSNLVGINDERFRDKVVVIQIMGSWCPNCMDETAFLSQYYRENKDKGVEVIGLAYEYTPDFKRASKNLMRFKQKFNVEYPMLITGVLSSDTLKTEKTLPQLTPIKAFPSMIYIGRDGKVKKTHAGYSGPATGVHHENFKKEFDAEIKSLLGGK
jgi:thiol-disulfide isomerase/thioredoxin